MKILRGFPPFLILILVNILAWYPALSFWFFRAWEPTWLIGVCGQNVSVICLMRGHAFLYLINYKIFGWNPWGWYLTAILLHILSVLLVYKFSFSIFKKKIPAFIAALIFGVNVTHHDVVNWGSFEGLYALLFSVFILAIFSYKKFKEAKRKRKLFFYLTVLTLYAFALFLRESGLILPFFLLIYELLTRGFRLKRKDIYYIFFVFAPLGLLSLFYLYLRSWYGGAPNDFVDAMVQYRITLLSQGNYFEYLKRGILSFGRFAIAHPIPYPILNEIREFLAGRLNAYMVNFYFFSLAGILYIATMCVVMSNFIRSKVKIYKEILIFSFLWFLIPTLFFSFAWTVTDDALLKEYVWDASRWRYFAFLGTVLFWLTAALGYYERLALKKKKTARKLALVSLLFLFLLNFYLLRNIQREMYETTFGPAKNFYTTFQSNFKTLPEDFVFYHFPASILNDYLAEWYLLREVYYPNLRQPRRDWAEIQMGMLLKRLQEKTAGLASTFFLDIDKDGKLIDKTSEVKEILRRQGTSNYQLSKWVVPDGKESVDFSLGLKPKLQVEFPYRFTLTLAAFSNNDFESSDILGAFARERDKFIKSAKVDVCATAPAGSSGSPAMHLTPAHLTDGALGGRSLWTANCRRPAWIILDLGEIERLASFAFHARAGSPGTPSDYTIWASKDREVWESILTRNLNTSHQRMERFPFLVKARYIKFEINDTIRGGFPEFDEVMVITQEAASVLDKYQDDFETLVKESYGESPSLIFSWKVAPTDSEQEKYVYVPINPDGRLHSYSIEPNESEVYSLPGEFLGRFIEGINLEFSGSLSKIQIVSLKIEPKYKIND